MLQTIRAAGYGYLVGLLDLSVVANWHESLVAIGNVRHTREGKDRITDVYPSPYWPGDGLGEQLEFALKYDGTNPHILAAAFAALSTDQVGALATFINDRPLGKYRRRLWYLFETYTGRQLSIRSLDRGPLRPVARSRRTVHGRKSAGATAARLRQPPRERPVLPDRPKDRCAGDVRGCRFGSTGTKVGGRLPASRAAARVAVPLHERDKVVVRH